MRKQWTIEEDETLRRLYSDHFAKDICLILGRSMGSVRSRVSTLGLKSSYEKLQRSGRLSSANLNNVGTRFKKGHVPANKGKKMSTEQYEKCKATMFKKGGCPPNHRPVGSERVNVDGYVEIKVAEPNKWRLKHRVLWEEAHGPIPKGYNIQFKDGNRQNLAMDNLYMLSRADQIRNENNLYCRYPDGVIELIRAKAQLKSLITKRKKKLKNERN